MKTLAWLGIAGGAVSMVVGIISRIMLRPVPIVPGTGLEANAFLSFSAVCFLAAIAVLLMAQTKE